MVGKQTTVLPPDLWACVCAGSLTGDTITFVLHRASALCLDYRHNTTFLRRAACIVLSRLGE